MGLLSGEAEERKDEKEKGKKRIEAAAMDIMGTPPSWVAYEESEKSKGLEMGFMPRYATLAPLYYKRYARMLVMPDNSWSALRGSKGPKTYVC